MSRPTFISAGSNTTVKTGPGTLYGVHITPANGASVTFIDGVNLGTTPDLNSVTLTGLIARVGVYGGTTPDFIEMKGAHFTDGLTIAATSNARLTVLTD